MSYKNWDHVRDNRIYAYLNEKEMAQFLEAMQQQDLHQNATAARQFIIERSKQIIEESKRKKQQQQTVYFLFNNGNSKVN